MRWFKTIPSCNFNAMAVFVIFLINVTTVICLRVKTPKIGFLIRTDFEIMLPKHFVFKLLVILIFAVLNSFFGTWTFYENQLENLEKGLSS